MVENRRKLNMLIITALFASITAVLAQVSIPMVPVPITGQTLAIGLAATILGSRYGTLSAILYMLLGAIGAPVFAGFASGFGVLIGPTGGFILGFIPTTFIMGYYLEKTNFTVRHALIANIIGMFVTLFIGTAWLKYVADLSWTAAFSGGFYPFLIGGVIKAFVAATVGIMVRERLKSANLLFAVS